jgi:hypothetical protein
MGIIDVHTHLPTRKDVSDARDLPFLEGAGVRLSERPPVDELLREMDDGAIDIAVVLGPPPAAGTRQDNDALAAAIRPHRDRLIGFGMVDPRSDPDVSGSVRRCVEQLGLRGIGEFGYVNVADPVFFPLYEACIALDVPILIHTGTTLPSTPIAFGHPSLLDEVVIRYPDLKVIAAHCGVPWFVELACVAARHTNVWIDVSALPLFPEAMRYQILLTMLAAHLGGRLLFGSDFPVVRPGRWARWAGSRKLSFPLSRLLGLPAFTKTQHQAFMEGNARCLLRL